MPTYSTRSRRALGGIDPKLLIVLGVLVVIGIAFFAWDALSGGSAVAGEKRTFICYFDQEFTVELTNQEVNEWRKNGDAAFPLDRRADPPTRVKCPDCGRLSCIERDPTTHEMPELSDAWVAILNGEVPGNNNPSPMLHPQ